MLRIGAHMSVAGGVANAVERAALHGCEALQIFSKNASQWRGRPLDAADVRRFRRRIDETGISPVVSHASYLINLATATPALREQSIAALVDELDRADTLGLMGVVLHPGACTSGAVDAALRLVADAIRSAFEARPAQRAMLLLEHTAGQGRTIGHRFDEIGTILQHLQGDPRVGVCLDTCHLLAAGYDIRSAAGYAETFEEFDRTIGLARLRALHANDSKTPLGSRVDRHAHIGEGHLGLEPFRRLLGDGRLAGRPLLLETAKTTRSTPPGAIVLDPLDVRNLAALRALRADGASPA
ncbi:MAG: deoxyribonuclease IV [Acidobacteria bacterium]|nr:deoxyribonuclease IV [Acidobacteriota bacterium]